MMHPVPMWARSRTWDWFQMLVPSPISASGATSAVGWMRTDGRSFMRSPAVRRFYPAARSSLGSSSSGGEREDAGSGCRDGPPPMAHALLLLGCQLGGRDAGGELEDRVVAKAAAPPPLGGNCALHRAAEQLHRRPVRAWIRERQPADHARPPIGDPFQPLQQDSCVVAGAGATPAGRAGAGPPIEGGHLDAGVIRQGQEAGCLAEGDRLVPRVVGVGQVRLRDRQPQADLLRPHDPYGQASQQAPKLAELASVVGRDQEVPHSPGGASIAACWRSNSWWMPAAARSTMRFICSRSNAFCSPVPWISTKRSLSVITMFMSTSAVESSP